MEAVTEFIAVKVAGGHIFKLDPVHAQYKIAEEYSEKMRHYPADIPTAYSGNYGNEWVHLVLTYVIQARLRPLHTSEAVWTGGITCNV